MQLWRHGKIETKKMFQSRAICRQQSIHGRVSSLEKLAGPRDCRCIGCVNLQVLEKSIPDSNTKGCTCGSTKKVHATHFLPAYWSVAKIQMPMPKKKTTRTVPIDATVFLVEINLTGRHKTFELMP